MNNENDIMDSLLREHAKNKGVDEKFLSDLEVKLDAEVQGNVIPLDRASNTNRTSRGALGLGLGVAACAALYVAGTYLWKNEGSPEVIALDSGAAKQQIESAKEEVRALNIEQSQPLEAAEKSELYEKKDGIADTLEEKPTPPKNMPKAHFAAIPSHPNVPVPEALFAEPSLDFGDGSDFGTVFGGVRGEKANAKARAGIAAGGGGAQHQGGQGIAEGGCVVGRDDVNFPRPLPGYPMPPTTKEIISAERYGKLIDNDFKAPIDKETKLSTFAIDVDTASYSNVRRMINTGVEIYEDAVRIEEMINYFDYQYAKPALDGKQPFAIYVDAAECPWNKENKLVRVALQGKEIIRGDRPASNVVFLIDVSGSMNSEDKLPLLKESLKYLLEEMNEKDTISIVVYAGASGLTLPATKVDAAGRLAIMKSLENLSAGGSTAGGEGITLAYQIAQENFIKGGVNRVILATDGDFNVGVSDANALSDLVKKKAVKGVDISVLGFGTGNLNDEMMELITNNGNGNYSYIDTIKEGRKVLLEDMMGTLVTIAKDVKIQVEFNPERVKEYRLIGYSNRMLPNEAFLDKRADAGEIGAGHRVTAFYEIVPGKALDKIELDRLRYDKNDEVVKREKEAEIAPEFKDELLNVKLAYKQPDQKVNDESTYLSVPLKDGNVSWDKVDDDFKFASSVALFGMILRDSEHIGDGDFNLALKLAESGKGLDGKGLRGEFINLIKKMKEREVEFRKDK